MLSWMAMSSMVARQLAVGLTLVVLAFVGLEVALFLLSALFAD